MVAAAATASSGIVQQLFGGDSSATAQKPQQPSKQHSSGGRRGAKQRAQQTRVGGANAATKSSSTIQTSYSTLEQLLAPAIDTLVTFAVDVEHGAQELMLIFNRLPFMVDENSSAMPSLFGEPDFSSSAGNNFVPAEWERFRFVFTASGDEASFTTLQCELST